MNSELDLKIKSATKWSAIGEVTAKLVTPISTIILARVLTPEAFGVIATITMILSFAEIFMDAGLQRFLIQKDYESTEEKFRYATVAFWSNFLIGLICWIIIIIFRESLATLVGNPRLGKVLGVAAISIPINALTSIQMAIFKHSLDFKSLFYRRIASIVIPIVVTVPLAFILKSYWALVWGVIASNIATTIILTFFSPWRPSFFYNWGILKSMLGYSTWSLLDAVLIWATTYLEIFFIGILLNEYYLGLYRTSITTVCQFISIISGIILPVLMPALARTQNDFAEMRRIILKFQHYLAIILLPLGALLFGFRAQITDILLGPQWSSAANFIGIWGLSEVIMLLFSRFCSNIYPAIGKPQISVIAQFIHLIFVIPVVYISAKIGFETLCWCRTFVRLQGLLVNWFFAHKTINLSVGKTLSNVAFISLLSIVIAIIASLLTMISNNNWMMFIWIPCCILPYLLGIWLHPNERTVIKNLLSMIKKHTDKL